MRDVAARELMDELLVWAPRGARLVARTEGAMLEDEALDFLEAALTRV
jgi:hypothetical protein